MVTEAPRQLAAPDRNAPTLDGEKKRAQERAAIILDNYKRSMSWMKDGFYEQWERVHKNYLCEADAKQDPYADDAPVGNNTVIYDSNGQPYPTKQPNEGNMTSLSTPDTWSLERRRAARATAQLPNLRYKAPEQDLADRVSRALMYQWDMMVQPTQKRHVLQADMFGISVRPWSFITEREHRMRTINPLKMTPEQEQLVQGHFAEDLQMIQQSLPPIPDAQLPPGAMDPRVYAELLKLRGNGTRLRVGQEVMVYTGPKADFLFVGDCFFEPMFQSLQESAWFIVERRRSKEWFEDLVKAYPDSEAGRYVEDLLKRKKHGTPFSHRTEGSEDVKNLRENMASIVGQQSREGNDNTDPDAARWTVLEIHYTGRKARVEYLCETTWLGAYDQPHELGGRIPFTSLCLHESLMHGIGDTDARVIRGLQDLRSRLVCQRADIADALLRPLVGTDDQSIMDDPSLVKRWKGLRLVQLKHPGAMWSIQDQAALAGAGNSFNEEGAMNRLIQQATNESNMSNSADADPQQGKTATGARIIARNQDILTRDMLNQLNRGIREDAQMMFRLNRMEMQEDLTFDGSGYRPTVGGPMGAMGASQTGTGQAGQPPAPMAPITVTPEDFQGDYQVEPEAGSTLAEDDEDNLNRATVLFQVAGSRPDLFNQMKARNELLIAYKQGHRLSEWDPPPAPEKPPGVEMKINASITAKSEELSPVARSSFERLLVASAEGQGASTVQSPTPEEIEGNDFTQTMKAMPMPSEEDPMGAMGGADPGDEFGEPMVEQ